MQKDAESGRPARRGGLRQGGSRAASGVGFGVRIRPMQDADLGRIRELRSVVRWSADPRAFDLLRGIRDARWAVAEAPDGSLVGMVGAVPLGEMGVLCHLAVRRGHRNTGLGVRLSSWAVTYLRSRGAEIVRLYSTQRAEKLYLSLGFRPSAPRTVYRLAKAPREPRVEAGGHRVRTLLFGDLPELYGVDRWSYGADRSALVFALLRLHPGGGLVARDPSGRIKGYLIRNAAERATRVGPFVAATPDVARLLLARALRAGVRASQVAPVEIAVTGPSESPAHALFEEFGFAGRTDRLRMELGASPDARPGERPGSLAHYGTTPYLAT